MSNPNKGTRPTTSCAAIDTAPGHLAHNMSSPPKSVVSFDGLSSMASQGNPGGSGAVGVGYQARAFFGTAVHFALHDKWQRLRTPGFLRLIENSAKRHSTKAGEARLQQLIEQRAKTLPLPDGCVTIPSHQSHAVLWSDPLSVLTILTKCTTTVWLRDKSPSLLAALDQQSVSLLVPPAFAHRLPAAAAPLIGEDHGH